MLVAFSANASEKIGFTQPVVQSYSVVDTPITPAPVALTPEVQITPDTLGFTISGSPSTGSGMITGNSKTITDHSVIGNKFSLLPTEPQVDPARFAISCGILGASITGIHVLQYNSWWKDQRTAFHVVDDPDYEANFDKFGHRFGGYYTCFFFDEAFTWSGFNRTQSILLSSLASILFEFYVEIEDGFARDWGFSPGDAKADIEGAAMYVIRNTIPFMHNFNYKLAYFPTAQVLGSTSHTHNPIDDYEGQSYWFTANINGLLPKSWQGVIPEWLNLGFGIGGYTLNSDDYTQRRKAYYIGLDYDIDKIFPESDIGILNFIRKAFGYWHFPAPAFRILPDPRFFILFPFKMTIG